MKFTLLTPSQQLAETEAASITIPGESGQFGVLPGHMPLVSTLQKGGHVSVTTPQGQTQTFTVTGGVVEVTPTQTTILAESAEISTQAA
ncbi:MAG: ATP synthase F1 subunit epsilon [Proteobacteria bacterium]|nr:ATP synthase F1 subunit epsilon [Pseudomonadota bacterium]NBX85741.1 ATP synthase F1 subunit epsilon [Pseudomonadota bacterium]